MVEKETKWVSKKAALENKLTELQTQTEASRSGSFVSTNSNDILKIKYIENERTTLKLDLYSHS